MESQANPQPVQTQTNTPQQPAVGAPKQSPTTPTPSPTSAIPTNTNQPTPPAINQPPSKPVQPNQSQPIITKQKPAGNRLLNPIIGVLLLIAVSFIGYFIYCQAFSGTVEYESELLTFSSGQVTHDIDQQLEPTKNPYRPQVSLKYQRSTGGVNIGSTNLASYTITINDQSQQSVYQDGGSFSFRGDDDDEEGLGTSSVTTSTNSKDFLAENSGQYQFSFTAQIPDDLDTDFNIQSIQFRLRSQVKTAPTWVLIAGLVSLFTMIGLIIFKQRSKKNN
jgi:hypothetical protein